MKNWIPITGNFSEDNERIIFHGGIWHPLNSPLSENTEPIGQTGILLFNEKLSNGTIEATVEFEKLERSDEAEIIFNYYNQQRFICTGITNSDAKYELKSFANQWNFLSLSGFIENLPDKKFDLKVCLSGSTATLYINNIQAINYIIPEPIINSNIGFWARSKSSITFSHFSALSEKPKAFIVSQFGSFYDILYEEVIKPLCMTLGYEPIRGDEYNSCTLILDDIIAALKNASIIIADITPDNPNVFYELGYAHAIHKPTILLCEKSIREKLPFDISGYRTIFYDNSIAGKSKIEEQLKKYLQTIYPS